MVFLSLFIYWKLDFIGSIYLIAWHSYKQILVATNYTIKQVEIKPLCSNIAIIFEKFIFEYIIIHFGCPSKIYFMNTIIYNLMKYLLFKHFILTIYYLDENKQAKSANKPLINMIKQFINRAKMIGHCIFLQLFGHITLPIRQ